jgi:plastocyanin domain-containing protein
MELDKVIVFIASLGGIGFTYWFFLMKKEKEVAVTTDSVDIVVKGGYNPEVISIPYKKTTKLNFLRKDTNSCLEEVVLGDFRIKKYLPVNEKVTITVTPEKKGAFRYSCGMGMFHGKIIVK